MAQIRDAAGLSMMKKLEEAEKQVLDDAEVLQQAIIHGKLDPPELASALAAQQRQIATTIRLLYTLGDDKFITKASVRPWVTFLVAIGGSALSFIVGYALWLVTHS